MKKKFFKSYLEFILEDISRRKFLKTLAGGAAALALGCTGSSCQKDPELGPVNKYRLDIKDKFSTIASVKVTAGGSIISNYGKDFYSNEEVKVEIKLKSKPTKEADITTYLYHNDVSVRLLRITKSEYLALKKLDYNFSYISKPHQYKVSAYCNINSVSDGAVSQVYLGSSSKNIKGNGSATLNKTSNSTSTVSYGMNVDANACNAATYSILIVSVDDDEVSQIYNYRALSGISFNGSIIMWHLS